ncbi:hypothetical protein PEM37_39775 [Streptomyces sp. AD681]|uniref:hypothetical protein n=1 Tax=Streptomyces sp. AD681 TaxID=3019069 RepID=UPI0022F1BABD|nr:hypothetical protein [Streptomyces sp. AD681]MDA5147630.1 hypothetical protein [Streptomyces sp. AD681]
MKTAVGRRIAAFTFMERCFCMSKSRKSFVDDVLDRASDVGRDSRDLTRRALTGKNKRKKGKKSTRKLVKRNNRAIEALVVQLEQYIKHDREKAKARDAG